MKSVSISILTASIITSAALLYSGKQSFPASGTVKTLIADDLRVRPPLITKELVHATVTAPANHDRLKNINGFAVNPQKPLWIRATKDEGMIVVAYQVTASDGSMDEVWLTFEPDDFLRWKCDTNPPIYLNP